MDYAGFYHKLKTYLIDNELQSATDFTETTEDELADCERNLGLQMPLAYREWLKVFGKTELLLNFYIESYDLGALEMAQEEAEKDLVWNGVAYDYLLISAHESSFYTYLDRVGENPGVYQIALNNHLIKPELEYKHLFTTHIKEVITQLIHNLVAYNGHTPKDPVWQLSTDLLEHPRKEYFAQHYDRFLTKVEQMELRDGQLLRINEKQRLWNRLRLEESLWEDWGLGDSIG